MPLTNLNEKLLHVYGVLEVLIKARDELSNVMDLTPCSMLDSNKTILKNKLDKIRARVAGIFFEDFDEHDIQEALGTNASFFSPDYERLQHAFRTLFSNKTLDEMIDDIRRYPVRDWTPDEASLCAHYQRLNHEYGYFESTEHSVALIDLFRPLVMACRRVTVLIERNNSTNDLMAYDYAYKLMALFIESDRIPSFELLAKKINKLLTPNDRKPNRKPFHDVLLDLQLPHPSHDRTSWIALIEKERAKVLPLFSMAVKIEKETFDKKAPNTYKEAQNIAALFSYYRAEEDPAFAQLCHINHVSEETFDACLDFIGYPPEWPKKTMDRIPDVTIDQANSPYAWTKLPASDKRALILGEITDCCQSIDSDSEQCVKDAVSLENNGLYVLLKRKRGQGSPCLTPDGLIDDACFQIIGQSYVWITKTGNLCLDSIECLNSSISTKQLKSILTAFSVQVLQEHPNIRRVMLGTGGNTPRDLFQRTTHLPEAMREGFFYGDAISQYIIAHQKQRLTKSQIQSIGFKPVSPFNRCFLYLCEHMTDTTRVIEELEALVEENPSLPHRFLKEELFDLLRFTPCPTLDDLKPVNWEALSESPEKISTGRLLWQANTLKKKIKVLSVLPADQRLELATYKDSNAESLLHWAARIHSLDSIKMVLKLLPAEERIFAVVQQDNEGSSLLHLLANKPNFLRMVLTSLPKEHCYFALAQKDDRSRTVLHLVADKPNLLRMVLNTLSAEERFFALVQQDTLSRTVLHLVADKPNLLRMVLTYIPDDERIFEVMDRSAVKKSVSSMATAHPESLRMLLELLPAETHFFAMTEKDLKGNTLLSSAVLYPDSLAILLDLLTEDALFSAVTDKNDCNEMVLHLAVKNPKSLKMILQRLPVEALFSALRMKGVNGNTAFHVAADEPKPKSLRMLLALLPDTDLISTVREKNNWGHTMLRSAASHPRSLRIILNRLPAEECLSALREDGPNDPRILHRANQEPESLRMLLDLLPAEERLSALKAKKRAAHSLTGRSVLDWAVKKPELLTIILDSLPEKALLLALREKVYLGDSVLDLTLQQPELLKIVLKRLPEEALISVLRETNHKGHSVLYFAAGRPDSPRYTLSSLSTNDLLKLLDNADSPWMLGQAFAVFKEIFLSKLREQHYFESHLNRLEQASDSRELESCFRGLSHGPCHGYSPLWPGSMPK